MNPTSPMPAAPPQGVHLATNQWGHIELTLGEPLGRGTVSAIALSQWFFASTVHFLCERCPNVADWAPLVPEGRWMTINLCLEGRCEVTIPTKGCAVVTAGDCCISCTSEFPQDYLYPLGQYQGVELFINTELVEHDPAFALYRSAGGSLDELASAAGLAAVFSGDAQLNGHLARIKDLLDGMDMDAEPDRGLTARCAYECLGLLLDLLERDVAAAQPRGLLTPRQIAMAQEVATSLSMRSTHPTTCGATRSGTASAPQASTTIFAACMARP